MIIEHFNYSFEELQDFGDNIKEVILKKLVKEEIITEEQLKDFTATHTLILKRRSKISKFLDKLFKFEEKDPKNSYSIFLAKINDIRND